MENKQFDFINPITKEKELISLERWVWGVVYKDETELRQFDDNGKFHRLSEIDQKNIKIFTMYRSDDMNKRYDIVMPEGARIIHKYRNIRPFYMNRFVKVYMFGYRTGKKDFEYHYHFILPDDRMVISNKDNVDLVNFELQRT